MTLSPSEAPTFPRRTDTRRSTTGPAGREVGAIFLAVIGWLGAAAAFPRLGGPVIGVGAALLTAAALVGTSRSFSLGRWSLLAVGVFLLYGYAGAVAAADHQPVSAGRFDGSVTIIDDPRPVGSGWMVVVRIEGGNRVEAVGYGQAGWDLADARIGQRYEMRGRLRPPGDREWLRVRHITGRLSVEDVGEAADAGARWLISETFRDLVVSGSSNMSERQQALYLGLVIGDDRFQPLGQRLRFRASGLTHLLAVSGQNVAFVLAVLSGPLRLLGRRSRLIITVAALLVFAVVTRLEPSVLRATASATLAVWASATGRERSGLMVLSAAVLVLLLIDPFLVDSIGFQLSVAASAGILLLQPLLQRRIPGPSWLGVPLSTTAAAQLGVSPILGLYFGPVSLASIPANLLAGWAAGAVMTLGLSVGILAGMVPASIGAVLQLPTVVLLSWIESVAAWHATTAAPQLGPAAAIGLSTLALALLPSRTTAVRRPTPLPDGRIIRCLSVILPCVIAAIVLVNSVPRAPSVNGPCGNGITWYPPEGQAGSVLVVTSRASGRSVEQCMDAGIGGADVLVSVGGGRHAADLVAALREVIAVPMILAPPQHRIVGARRQLHSLMLLTGTADLLVKPAADGMTLTVVEQHRS